MSLQSKTDTQSIAIANATAAQIKTFAYDTLADYKTIRGFYVIRNSGSDYLRIKITDGSGNTILAPVNINHLVVTTGVKIEDRFFKATPFGAAGKKVIVTIEWFSTTSALQDLDIVWLYDNN